MNKVALITGAAKRIGAVIARTLHKSGINVVIHYHRSQLEAEKLCQELNKERRNSAITVAGNIIEPETCKQIIQEASKVWGQLDILINNASSFYATKIGEVSLNEWDDLLGSNLKGPFFLSQAAAPFLQANHGCIVNIADIHAERPLKHYTVYCIAKAGLVMLTKSLARELGPSTRVNAVAPGAILWPDAANTLSSVAQDHIVARTCLKRKGDPKDIAEAVLFLVSADYVTGQVIAVDGGRSVKD